MIAELGQITLGLAFIAAIYQAIYPLIGVQIADAGAVTQARHAAIIQGALVAFAFVLLTVLHAASDFSVRNVFENSHTAKPYIYKLSGVWGNHEGSMLLWILILSGFGTALALTCLLYTSPSPRDRTRSRMPSSA